MARCKRSAARALVLVAVLGPAAQGWAHGGNPALAFFTSPPPVTVTSTDGGERAFAPYVFPTADASFEVGWEDGDLEAFSQHVFYYVDRAMPQTLSADEVVQRATLIPETAAGIWAACSCPEDLGTACPDAGVRDCRNAFTWDTRAVPPGSYWLVAVTTDAPFKIYTVSQGPVRVAHGGPLPPAVIVTRPDGLGVEGERYRVRWLVAGAEPIRVDLAYASDVDVHAGAPFTPIAADVPRVAAFDATFAYDWDISALGGHTYYVRAVVSDATGLRATSDSRAGLALFRAADPPATDMATRVDPPEGGCGCRVGAGRRSPPVGVGAALVLALLAARRRRRATR